MTRAVLYVPGSSRHLLDQSGELIADRIARGMAAAASGREAQFRVTTEVAAHTLASGITLDRATIEHRTGSGADAGEWAPLLHIFELGYLEAFARPFSELSPLQRFLRAGRIAFRDLPKALRALGRADTPKRAEDKAQAAFLGLIVLVSVVSLLWWLALAIAGILGVGELFSDLNKEQKEALAATALFVAGIAAGRVAARELIDAVERSAVEFYAIIDFLDDPRPYAPATNAVLDALELLHREGYAPVDLMAFSLGCLVTEEAIWPRRARIRSDVPPVENWITLGHPHELIASVIPHWSSASERTPVVPVRRWINLVATDDFLGSEFRREGVPNERRPGVQLRFEPAERVRTVSRRDRFVPFRRILNHALYWDDKDARAPTCFPQVATAAGWAGPADEPGKGAEPAADGGRAV